MKLWKRHYRSCAARRVCAARGAWAATAAAAFVALLFAAWAPQARAQGARKDDVVINGAGQPVGGASVAICNSTATIGTSATPCSPLATIYTDATLTTPAANPFPADGLGNYGFWAPPGTYQVQLYGTQIATTLKTVVLPCVPGSNCAGGGGSSPNAAMKPGASDAIQYVSPNGNDSNDGLSIGTAKLTIMAGYDALGQGGGTIYISGSSTSGAYCTSTAGQGIWIMGSADPNYSSPPTGWRKMKLGGPVYFVGLSANTSPSASTTSWTTVVNCGNNSNPGVWLSGVSGVTISRLRMVSESARVSMDSNGGRNNATNLSAQIEFDHDDFRSDCFTCGPAMDVGGNMLWLNVHDSTFENGAIANWSVSANSSQASNISISNGGGSGAIGLLYFTQNFFTGGGGLRFDADTNGLASVYAAHTLMEGAGACQPVYEIVNGGAFAATFDLQGGFSDCGASPPFVKVAAGNQPCQTSVRGINQGGQVPGLEGPLTVGDAICPGGNPSGGVSISDAGVPSGGVIPAAKGQSGGAYGTSQNADSYRRSFAPSLVRFANTANQLPATWTAYQGSGQTLTPIQGPGDPAGSANAATLSCTSQSGFGCSYYAFDSSITFNAGDYVYVGAWMQAASTAGFGNGSAIGVIFPFANGPTMRQMTGGPAGVGGAFSGGTTQLSSSPYLQNDGNWQYVWGLSKVTAPFSGVSGTIFAFAFQPGYAINVYAPMFVRIPASSVAVVSAPTFSSASESGNIVTFTTSAAHNLSRGEPIVVSGCSVGGYNGEFVLGNTISSTTFTVYNSATGLGSPTSCVITPENDSEVADWANNLKPYSDKCSTGVLCGVVSNPAISASGLNSIIYVDGVKYTTLQAAITAAQSAGGTNLVVPPGTYSVSTNLFSGLTNPLEIDFIPPVLVQATASQVISTSNVKMKMTANPYNNNVTQRTGVRWQATASLGGPMFQINGPVNAFDLDSIHLDCNGNATYGVYADRMNTSHWSGTISAANCTTMGFRFAILGTTANSGTGWNTIDDLWFWGNNSATQCVEMDANSVPNADFDLNNIGRIDCGGLAGSSGANSDVFFKGADGNTVGQINCYPYSGGTGAPKACVEFGGALAYENVVSLVDSSMSGTPVVAADSGNSYPNVVSHIHMGNYLTAGGGNAVGGEVSGTGILDYTGVGGPQLNGSIPVLSGTGACATFSGGAAQGPLAGVSTCTGTTGASTITLAFGYNAKDGWTCIFQDRTTRANVITQTSYNQGGCTGTATSVTSGDAFTWLASPF